MVLTSVHLPRVPTGSAELPQWHTKAMALLHTNLPERPSFIQIIGNTVLPHIRFTFERFAKHASWYKTSDKANTLNTAFYIRGSMHRNSRLNKSNEIQQCADIYVLLNYSTCFGRSSRPSSGVHETVGAASSTDHSIWGASFLKLDKISPYLVTSEEACSPDSMICTGGCNYSFV